MRNQAPHDNNNINNSTIYVAPQLWTSLKRRRCSGYIVSGALSDVVTTIVSVSVITVNQF